MGGGGGGGSIASSRSIDSESSRIIFSFFCLHPVGQTFLYPNKFCNYLKYSDKS